MAIENKYVNEERQSGQIQGDSLTTGGGRATPLIASEEIAAADDDGSVYRFFSVPSNAVTFPDLAISHDSITGGTDYDVGFYYPREKGGAVISKDCLADGLTLASAAKNASAFGKVDVANYGKPNWVIAGLSADPGGVFDIALTGNTVGTAAGTVTLCGTSIQH